jgi:hypothetical protein
MARVEERKLFGPTGRTSSLWKRYSQALRSDHGRTDETASISIQVTFRHTCNAGVRRMYTITDNIA